MKPVRNHYILLIAIVLFTAFGCNLLDSNVGESAQNSSETNETAGNDNSAVAEESGNIPDLDFPEGEKPETTPENTGGDKSTVVRFAKGTSSANFKNSIEQNKTYTYVIDAAKGQTMRIELSSAQDNAGMYIKTPNGGFLGDANESEWTDNYNGQLPADGKYRVVVTTSKGTANFMLSLSVTGKAGNSSDENSQTIESKGGLTTVVKFRKGDTFAIYKNAVIRGERNKYILGAASGQRMEVSIDSVEDNAVFDIQAPNGSFLARERKSWNGQLPANGNYRITVGGTRGNATYTIGFSVR
ncbi:MAG: PPC domain-containing protein [Pyrinomonadaceae bacterium]